jgi:nicotinate-nucleotide adenylyltransferase
MDRPGPHYSVDTVALLQSAHPDAELYFVMGADSLRDLLTWHQPEVLIQRCYLAVMPRPGVDISPDMHADVLPQLAERVRLLDAPLLEISSTAIVNRVRQGRSVRYVVPAPVLNYIHEKGLYS